MLWPAVSLRMCVTPEEVSKVSNDDSNWQGAVAVVVVEDVEVVSVSVTRARTMPRTPDRPALEKGRLAEEV